MMLRGVLTTVMYLAVCLLGQAQEQPNMLFFQDNMLFYNPAFTGTYGQMASFNNRTQWAGIAEAPVLQSFAYNRDFKNKAAWGLSFQNDQIFIEQRGTVAADYNYRLELGNTHKLYLGIKAGGYFTSIDKTKLFRLTNTPNNALDAVRNYSNPLLGLGINYQTNNFHLAAGVPNILNSKRYKENEGLLTTATDRPNLYLSSSFTVAFSETLSLTPALLYRSISDAPNFLNLQLSLTFKEKMLVGISKMNNDYMGAMFLFKGMSFIDIGYAYEFSSNRNNRVLRANNHELFARIKWASKSPTQRVTPKKNSKETKEIKEN